ncbi:unnamed protein product [Paramecium octaurelia]|uniref:Uncharacterized protein n=1 Tax=Paramecium octaurelia TaxID=43137 RepID=A0A8S1XEE5_PAROT|nr:unnamed protein product [Paramecium octaurelia]
MQDPLQAKQYFNEAVGISKKVKFIAIHNLIKNYFYEKAKNFQMTLLPDWDLSEYKTQENLNPYQQQYLEQINQQINNMILFSVFCKNCIEKNAKKDFLQTHLDELTIILESSQGNLFLGEVEEPQEFARQLKKLIFILNLNEYEDDPQNNQNPQILQKQILLNRFISDHFKSHTVVIQIRNPKLTRAELKEMVKDFCKQYQNIKIKVGYNRFQIPSLSKVIYLEIESYIDAFIVYQAYQQQIQEQASKILRLNDWEKSHFQKYICKLPLITHSKIKFKDCETGIKLNNTFHQIKAFRNEVNKLLESLKCEQIYLKIDAKLSTHLELIDIQQKKHILTNLFMDLTQQQNILYIKNIESQYIEVMVYLNKFQANELQTLESYLNKSLTELQIASFQMNQLNQLGLTTEEFQQKYSALMYIQNDQMYFILHSKYLNQVTTKLETYKTLLYLYYKPKSKLYAQQMVHDYKNKIMEQSQKILSIKLSQNQEIVYFESPEYDMRTLSIFHKYEQKLDQLLLEIPIKISKLEAKYLYNNCQQDIEKLCQEQLIELNFNFTKNQQEIQQQTTKIQFLKFKKKEVYFDTDLNCELSLRKVNNNNQHLKIAYKKQDEILASQLKFQEYFLYYQKYGSPYTQIGVVYEEIKDTFHFLIEEFLSLYQTRFMNLLFLLILTNTNLYMKKNC